MTSVLRSLEQPELTYRTNVAGTNALLEAGRAAGVTSLAFASTNAVTGPMEAPKITEAATLRAAHAVRLDQGGRRDADVGLHGLLRPALRLHPPDQRLRTRHAGQGQHRRPADARRSAWARTFEIYGDGNQVRDYVHAPTSWPAMRLALTSEQWAGPMVIGSGTSLSVHEVVDAVRDVSGAELAVRHGPAKPGEMPAVIVDPSRAHAAGWSPRYPQLADGLVGVWEEWSTADVQAPVRRGGRRDRAEPTASSAEPSTTGSSPPSAAPPRPSWPPTRPAPARRWRW